LKITKCWIKPEVNANPKLLEAIKEADLITLGPSDLYSSLMLLGYYSKNIQDYHHPLQNQIR